MVLTTFRRKEKKFMITEDQAAFLARRIPEYMDFDPYCVGDRPYRILNLYFDTDTNEIIRRSIEKPLYKEKLRIRSYDIPKDEDTPVYFELKKKFDGTVIKRRAVLTRKQIAAFLQDRTKPEGCNYKNNIVLNEIGVFLDRHPGAEPKILVGYDRTAYFAKDDPEVRLTFDRNILTRRDDLTLEGGLYGTPLLSEGQVLMEIKVAETPPRWMMKLFSEAKIYRTSFSKYGAEYERKLSHERNHQ